MVRNLIFVHSKGSKPDVIRSRKIGGRRGWGSRRAGSLSFIHLLNRLLRAYCVPGTVLGTGYIVMNKQTRSRLHIFYMLVVESEKKN